MTDEEPLEIRDRTFNGERIDPFELVPNSEVVGVSFEDCDVVGVFATKSRLERVTVTRGRLRGVTWAGGVLRDVTVDSVAGSDVSARFSQLRVVTFRDCQLPGLDLTEADIDDVTFERCDLRQAKFDHAKVKNLRIEACNLAGVSGATSLRGATMTLDDVLGLAPSLARELGITIE